MHRQTFDYEFSCFNGLVLSRYKSNPRAKALAGAMNALTLTAVCSHDSCMYSLNLTNITTIAGVCKYTLNVYFLLVDPYHWIQGGFGRIQIAKDCSNPLPMLCGEG